KLIDEIRNILFKMYYLITDENDVYEGVKINDGLNFGNFKLNNLIEPFKNLKFGFYLRKIRLPVEHPDFKRNSNKVNMIFVEERYSLSELNTWIVIQDFKFNYYCLRWLMMNSNIEIIRFFILSNLDNNNEFALQL